MNLHFTNDRSTIRWEALQELIWRGDLGIADVKTIQRVWQGSYACYFAYDGDKLIAAARAISDGVLNSTIYDVVVDPEYQRQGIGRAIMQGLLAQLPERAVMLVSILDKQEFYRKLGFKKLTTAYMLQDDFDSWLLGGYFEE